MALNFDRPATNDAPTTGKSGGNYEKAFSFFNIAMPNDEGGTNKIDALKLKPSNPDHVQIIEAFDACATDVERDALCKNLISQMVGTYRLASDPNRAKLKLA
jgi:hypothetical protein